MSKSNFEERRNQVERLIHLRFYDRTKYPSCDFPELSALQGYGWGCSCSRCETADKAWRDPAWTSTETDAALAKKRAANREFDRARQRSIKVSAHRSAEFLRWTGPELEVASREDMSISEMAKLLGRTYYSVQTMRRRLKRDPRYINLEGTRQPPPGSIVAFAQDDLLGGDS